MSAARDLLARLSARRAAMLAAAAATALAGAVLDIGTGPAFLAPGVVARAMLGAAEDRAVEAIVWTIRLPVAALALGVGAALGLSGAVMQTILNNPLASCYTLGISAAAGFGAALAIVAGLALPLPGDWAVAANAFVFAGLACGLVLALGRLRGMTAEAMVLAGIALLFLFQALLALLQFVASPEALQQVVFWLFGSLSRATWAKSAIVAAACALAIPVVMADAWRLTAARLGDDRARALGVDMRALRLRCFLAISVLTGAAVAFAGTIGFVGLVAPHAARMLVGEDQRFLLPMSAACGAALLSLASVASKTILPGALLPIGIVTAMIGVPFFAWLVARGGRGHW